MDDYLEEMFDHLDLQEEILATMDDEVLWQEDDSFRLMCTQCQLLDQEDIHAYL
ncbi:MAG: hypothetical protein PVF34_11270 [Gammaproteobacteria bacterium]|jgi:hypothetical protein